VSTHHAIPKRYSFGGHVVIYEVAREPQNGSLGVEVDERLARDNSQPAESEASRPLIPK
jgi:hypothetical protein